MHVRAHVCGSMLYDGHVQVRGQFMEFSLLLTSITWVSVVEHRSSGLAMGTCVCSAITWVLVQKLIVFFAYCSLEASLSFSVSANTTLYQCSEFSKSQFITYSKHPCSETSSVWSLLEWWLSEEFCWTVDFTRRHTAKGKDFKLCPWGLLKDVDHLKGCIRKHPMLLMALTKEFHLKPLLLLYVFPLKLHWISFYSEVSFEFPHCFSTVRAGRLGTRNRLASKPSNCLGPLPPNFLDCSSLSHFPTPNQKQPLIPASLRPWNRVWVILGTQALLQVPRCPPLCRTSLLF